MSVKREQNGRGKTILTTQSTGLTVSQTVTVIHFEGRSTSCTLGA